MHLVVGLAVVVVVVLANTVVVSSSQNRHLPDDFECHVLGRWGHLHVYRRGRGNAGIWSVHYKIDEVKNKDVFNRNLASGGVDSSEYPPRVQLTNAPRDFFAYVFKGCGANGRIRGALGYTKSIVGSQMTYNAQPSHQRPFAAALRATAMPEWERLLLLDIITKLRLKKYPIKWSGAYQSGTLLNVNDQKYANLQRRIVEAIFNRAPKDAIELLNAAAVVMAAHPDAMCGGVPRALTRAIFFHPDLSATAFAVFGVPQLSLSDVKLNGAICPCLPLAIERSTVPLPKPFATTKTRGKKRNRTPSWASCYTHAVSGIAEANKLTTMKSRLAKLKATHTKLEDERNVLLKETAAMTEEMATVDKQIATDVLSRDPSREVNKKRARRRYMGKSARAKELQAAHKTFDDLMKDQKEKYAEFVKNAEPVKRKAVLSEELKSKSEQEQALAKKIHQADDKLKKFVARLVQTQAPAPQSNPKCPTW